MRFYSNIYKVTFCTIGLLFAVASMAQTQTYSPFSRFGVGEINSSGSSFQRLSLNSNLASTSKELPNFLNKASLASLSAPVFDFSFAYNNTQLENAQGKQNLASGALGSLLIALPLQRGFALGLGLSPVSSVGYKSTNTITQDSIQGFVINEGEGGLNSVHASFAYNFLNKSDSSYLGVSLTGSYTFGSIDRSRSIEFTESYFKNTRNTTSLTVSDIRMEVGVLYNTYLSAASKIAFGLVYTPATNMNRSYNELTRHYLTNSLGSETFKDTVNVVDEKSGEVTLPSSLNFGVSYTLNRKLTVSASIMNTLWSDYKQTINGVETNLGTSDLNEFSFGIQYKPSTLSTLNESVFKQSIISVGFRSSTGYVNVNGEDIQSQAVSVGLSIPFRRSSTNSYFHFGTEVGSRGETDLIQERYAKVFIGLSISPKSVDRWFYKRKYN